MRKIAICPAALAAGASLLATASGPVSAALHDPGALPAVARDSRVRYGTNARDYAEAVARLMPAAVARVEAAQGRPFGNPFLVAAYLDDDAYAAANGLGNARARGVTFLNRVTLSPALWREEPDYLEADLTHELSHEHLFSHLSGVAYYQIPIWFTEGLASDGGGAQRVTAEEAEREIASSVFIATPDEAYFFGNLGLAPPPMVESDPYRRAHMAYREAGLFAEFLRAQNPAAFKRFMERLLGGERFKSAFEGAYGESVGECRKRFLARILAKAAVTE
jgi:hypothetical protein